MRAYKAFDQHIDLDHVLAISSWDPPGDRSLDRWDYPRNSPPRVVVCWLTLAFRDKPMPLWCTMSEKPIPVEEAEALLKEQYDALLKAWSPQSPTESSRSEDPAAPVRSLGGRQELGSCPFSIGGVVWPGLSKVVEETGELGQVLGKLMATGGDLEHWDRNVTLADKIIEEAGDVYAALDYFLEASGVDLKAVRSRRKKKRKVFWAWDQDERTKNQGTD